MSDVQAQFRWRLDSVEPMPESVEVLFWDRATDGSGGARVVVRDGDYCFDAASGDALDWSDPCWWAFIPPVPNDAEGSDA